jgi:hypothetical protein
VTSTPQPLTLQMIAPYVQPREIGGGTPPPPPPPPPGAGCTTPPGTDGSQRGTRP